MIWMCFPVGETWARIIIKFLQTNNNAQYAIRAGLKNVLTCLCWQFQWKMIRQQGSSKRSFYDTSYMKGKTTSKVVNSYSVTNLHVSFPLKLSSYLSTILLFLKIISATDFSYQYGLLNSIKHVQISKWTKHFTRHGYNQSEVTICNFNKKLLKNQD